MPRDGGERPVAGKGTLARIDEGAAIAAMGLDVAEVGQESSNGIKEEDYLENKGFQDEIRRQHVIKNDSDEQDVFERKRYASNAYAITQAWVGFLIVITIAQMGLKPIGMALETPEYIAFVTTATASVFGFWLLVGNYLFSRRGDKS